MYQAKKSLTILLAVCFFLILLLPAAAYAEQLTVRIRIIAGVPSLVGTLDFKDMVKPGGQNLSIIVTDLLNQLVSNATISANITLPDGTIVNASFVETNAGNYTFFYNFTDIGDHVISVHISKTPKFPQPISGSKTVTIGLVRFLDFTSESEVFQGSTMHFRFSARNMGNASSTIVPSFRIYDSSGNLIFSKEGVASTLEANLTASLIQFNIMSWFAGSAAPGIYNASGNILFTDTDNLTAYTPNKTLAFRVLQTTIAQPPLGGGVAAPIITKQILLPPAVVIVGPVREFMISNAPILVGVYPMDILTIPVSITNPLNKNITNISISIKGVPERWYFVPVDIIELGAGETKTIPVTFTIPLNADIGNNPAAIVVENHELRKEVNYVLRVSQLTEQQPALTYESAQVNEFTNTTSINIRVKNKEDSAKTLHIIVRIDKSIAQSADEVVFATEPSRIIQPDPIVEFKLENMKPGEERNITYFVRKMVVDTSPFFYSSIEQIQFIEIKPVLPRPVVAVEEKYTYTAATLTIVTIIAILVIYINQRKRIKEALKEAKRAVQKIAEKND